jgi:hypothetical protein
MDQLNTALKANADVARSVTDTIALNVAEALETALAGKGDSGVSEIESRRYRAVKNRLFLKYIGAEHEVATKEDGRLDTLRPALGEGS